MDKEAKLAGYNILSSDELIELRLIHKEGDISQGKTTSTFLYVHS